MAAADLTATRLRELLDYEADTGLFRWRAASGRYGRIPPATIAGGVDSNGYVLIRIEGGRCSAHRLAWFYVHGAWPLVVDHINGIKTDNRIANLRNTTARVNCQNIRRPHASNKSGHLGVCWHKGTKRWVAQMWIDGKLRTLSYHATAEAASAAYVAAKRVHHEGCTI